jgi:hypothetical protein
MWPNMYVSCTMYKTRNPFLIPLNMFHTNLIFSSSQINRHFYRDLYNILNKETKAALPVIDPTQGNRQ